MKQKLPLILFGVGILIFALVLVFVMKNKNKANDSSGDEVTIEIPFPDRPYVSLKPRSDGHWLDLKIEKIKVPKAASLDYELLYTLPDGRVQGVPGTVKLEGIDVLERELLLGSESSGKFRYDEGVAEGQLTVRFRDSKGKLLAKFATKFHMQTGADELTSVDQNFTYVMTKAPKGEYFVTMETFGLPASNSVTQVASGPYGVFTSADSLPAGEAAGFQKASDNLFYK
jgi:hypothetical protein